MYVAFMLSLSLVFLLFGTPSLHLLKFFEFFYFLVRIWSVYCLIYVHKFKQGCDKVLAINIHTHTTSVENIRIWSGYCLIYVHKFKLVLNS